MAAVARLKLAVGLGDISEQRQFGDYQSTAGFLARLGGGVLSTTLAAAATLVLAPNPATGAARLTLPAAPAPRLVQLLGALGREVRHQPVAANATSADLPLAGLSAGMHVVRCGLTTHRLVVE